MKKKKKKMTTPINVKQFENGYIIHLSQNF